MAGCRVAGAGGASDRHRGDGVGSTTPAGDPTDGGMQVDGVRRGLGAPRCHTKDRKLSEALENSSGKLK
jgi:hypothetical protein